MDFDYQPTVSIRELRASKDTKWTLEVVDAEGTSTVWDDEFDYDDDALAEFERTVRESGMLEFQPTAFKQVN